MFFNRAGIRAVSLAPIGKVNLAVGRRHRSWRRSARCSSGTLLAVLPCEPIFKSSFVADDCHSSTSASSLVELASSASLNEQRQKHPLSGTAGLKVAAE